MKKTIIVLDTETTGLPERGPGFGKAYAPWEITRYNSARLLQLAYAVYDVDGVLLREVSAYVRPSDFSIPADSVKIHGITEEFVRTNGKSVLMVLRDLERELRSAMLVVGHNVAFDRAIIQSEAWRNSMSEFAIMMDQIPWACTMRAAITGPEQKWPKLTDLHRQLCGEDFSGAHNAMEDVRATARCWLVMRKMGLIL